MSDFYRLKLSDGTTWGLASETLDAAVKRAETYFPHEVARVESLVDGAWRDVDPRCSCSPEQRQILSGLGDYCEDSCGRRP